MSPDRSEAESFELRHASAGRHSRRSAIGGLLGIGLSVAIGALPAGAAPRRAGGDGDRDGREAGGAHPPLQPLAFLAGFLLAEQDRDMERMRASVAPGGEFLWVHNGRQRGGERAYFAWLDTCWSGAEWSVEPDLAAAQARAIAADAACAICPVAYRYGGNAGRYVEHQNLALVIRATPQGDRVAALFTSDIGVEPAPRFP